MSVIVPRFCFAGIICRRNLSDLSPVATVSAGFVIITKCCVMQLAIPNTPGVADVWRLHWEAELVKLNEDMEVRLGDRTYALGHDGRVVEILVASGFVITLFHALCCVAIVPLDVRRISKSLYFRHRGLSLPGRDYFRPRVIYSQAPLSLILERILLLLQYVVLGTVDEKGRSVLVLQQALAKPLAYRPQQPYTAH